MPRPVFLLVLLAVFAVPSGVAAKDTATTKRGPLAAERRKAIAALIEPWATAEELVGVAVGVIDGDREGTFGYGTVALDDPRVPDRHTVFEIGSVSKVFTGLLLAHAVEDGAANLDDPVQKHVPEGVTIPTKDAAVITLAHLATHSSGLPRMPSNFAPGTPDDPYADYDAERMYAFLEDHRLGRAPGATWEYSNLATGLLGELLGAKAGGYDALMQAKIAKPLGMDDTTLDLSEAQAERLARPHGADGAPSHSWTFDALAGAGAIRSTLDDMLCFVRAHLDPPDSALGRAIARATSVQREGRDGETDMGLGWIIASNGNRWHNGQTGGYKSFVGMDLEHDRAVVVLSNTSHGIVDRIGNDVLRLLAGETVKPPEVEVPVAVEGEALERLVGTYAMNPAFEMVVTRQGRRLYVQATNQPRFRLFPRSKTEFFLRVVPARIVFELDGDDEPAKRLVLHQNGREMSASRK